MGQRMQVQALVSLCAVVQTTSAVGRPCSLWPVWLRFRGGTLGPYGENLAAGAPRQSVNDGIQSWLNEAPQYNPVRRFHDSRSTLC